MGAPNGLLLAKTDAQGRIPSRPNSCITESKKKKKKAKKAKKVARVRFFFLSDSGLVEVFMCLCSPRACANLTASRLPTTESAMIALRN